MPTKPNKAGQQQPYVPSGNGDASGEYADNQSGSNIHFTNFKKPEEAIDETKTEVETKVEEESTANKKDTETEIVEEKSKSLKDRLQLNDDLLKTLKKEYTNYLNYGLNSSSIKERLTKHLLDGDYGWFERPKEEQSNGYVDFYDSMEEWMNENKPEKFYYKSNNKWQTVYGEQPYLNKKLYTEEEHKKQVEKETAKNLQQSSYDKEINQVFGNGCAVAFGKSYSNEYMQQIVEASNKIVTDFPNMNGFIKAIGDRNSLEKLTQARARAELTEENIINKANEIIEYQKNVFGRNISIEDAKEKAREKILNGGLSLSRSGSQTLAYWSPSQRALVMLPKTAKNDADANQVSYYKQNWHSSDKPMATYYHEFGHAIDSMVSDYYNNKLKEYKDKNDYDKHTKARLLHQQLSYDIQDLKSQNFNSEYEKEYVSQFNKLAGTNYDSIRAITKDMYRSYNRKWYDITNEIKNKMSESGIKKYSVSEYGDTNTQEFVAESFSAYYTGMNNELANKVVERIKKFYNDVREL